MSPLKEFYAVTATGIWRVSAERDEAGTPVVERIGKRQCDPPHAIGQRLMPWLDVQLQPDEKLLVGVSTLGLYLYYHPERWPVEKVKGPLLGDHTLGLAALFLDRADAEFCLRCRGSFASEHFDPRWARETKQVIEAIGKDHPTFVVSTSAGFGFGFLFGGGW